MAALGSSSQNVTEYVVRVPKNTAKRYNIMAFNAADKVNFATWNQARLERDLSNKKIYQEEEMPESGAGSEFNRKLREEARRKKYGIVLKEFRPEDQPWLLRVNGKSGRKFKGIKKGGVTENTAYYIFTQCADGAFEAFPVQNWYNFTPLARHRTLTAEEAEEEWERRNKVLNHFSIMQQRRLKDQDQDEDEEEKEKRSRKKPSELRIHDLEDDLEMSSDASDASGEEGSRTSKAKKKAPVTKAGRKKKKKKGSDDEAFEDSDDGDFEGQEVDYMSDGSSSSPDETEGKPKVPQQEDGPKGVDEQSESSEESEEEKPPEEDKEEEEEKKAPTPQEKKRRKAVMTQTAQKRATLTVRPPLHSSWRRRRHPQRGSGSHRGGVQRAPVGQGLPVQKQQAPLLPCGLQPASWSRGSGRVRLQQPSVFGWTRVPRACLGSPHPAAVMSR
ncbi:general transcription factor IIF subunit 1 isoform 17 [Mus musculus]|uniref:general transcription factor IIF subunit 1 isoform 17 n=1 Tax=Mus musculus TaxID=10090 RepID=UPI002409234E|nr:general transcription factor IIF subunit 1 isoform 17 [Mus musculus]